MRFTAAWRDNGGSMSWWWRRDWKSWENGGGLCRATTASQLDGLVAMGGLREGLRMSCDLKEADSTCALVA